MTSSRTLDRLAEFGPAILQRILAVPHCILATRVGIDVLSQFGIAAVPLAVHVWVMNEAGWQLTQAAGDGPINPTRWVQRGAYLMTTTGGVLKRPLPPGRLPPWEGHLVIHVPARAMLIDLGLPSFTRPEHGVVLRTAGLFRWPLGSDGGTYTQSGAWLRYRVNDDDCWQTSPDWNAHPGGAAAIANRIARAIRAGRL